MSDRAERELRLRQAHKIEAIGRLAAGIAHDFNNLLTAIIGYASMALERRIEDESVRHDIQEIVKAGNIAASLTRQLLAFSRKQLLKPQVVDLNAIVIRMSGLLGRLIGEHIEIQSRLAEPLGRVSADPGQIEEVILNLALNARDAMPSGGTLSIETADLELDPSFVEGHPGSAVGPHIVLSIRDTGVGMDRGAQEHLFEPFYTTKEVGKGTGLGLATVYGIVKQSGGSIFVESEKDRGTTFQVYLPRVEKALDAPTEPVPEPTPSRVSETILLVEDQAETRSVVHEILARNGYFVLVAANGAEALLVAKNYGERIDLLFADVVLPGMSGRDLADPFLRVHPNARVLYMSGHPDDSVVQGVSEDTVAFIQKPFTPSRLLQTIREVLRTA